MIGDSHEGLDSPPKDVCIIGAGPIGICLAIRLAELGVSVLLLESGGVRKEPKIQELSSAEIENPDAHCPMEIAVARRLGGTSNLWGGRCLPFDSIDFLTRQGVVDISWPLQESDIQPYYARACELTDSAPADFIDATPPISALPDGFRMDLLERWSGTPRLQRLHDKTLRTDPLIDVRLHTVAVGFDFDREQRVDSIQVVRPDGTGRKNVKVKTVVIATGGVEATRLLLATQRIHPRLFGGPHGPLGRYYMAHVVGTIADIKFANKTLDAAFDFHVDQNGTYIRRRFAPTQDTQIAERVANSSLWPVAPPIADPSHKSGPLSAVYLGLAWGPIGRMLIPDAIRERHVPATPGPLGPHFVNMLRDLPATVPYMIGFVKKRFIDKKRVPGFYLRNPNMTYGLYYHSEQWPNPESRITLSDASDRLGLPRARIGFRFNERDADSVLRTHDAFADWLQRAGLGELRHRHPLSERRSAILRQAKHGPHQVGTTRMGRNAEEGVVDADLRTFSSSNLFVASSSSLPTSSQANPTLTTVALALRLAETLVAASGSAAQKPRAAVALGPT